MIKTAHEFRKRPHDIYKAAADGETVTINHDRHRDVVFELTARKRGAAIEKPMQKPTDTLRGEYES